MFVYRGEGGPEDGGVGEGVDTVTVGVVSQAHSDLRTLDCQLSQCNTDMVQPSTSAPHLAQGIFKLFKKDLIVMMVMMATSLEKYVSIKVVVMRNIVYISDISLSPHLPTSAIAASRLVTVGGEVCWWDQDDDQGSEGPGRATPQ